MSIDSGRRPPDDGFREFVRAQWGPLTRTAYLLTGDRSYAEDLVQSALEKTQRVQVIVGKANSGPLTTLSGQRCITAFCRV